MKEEMKELDLLATKNGYVDWNEFSMHNERQTLALAFGKELTTLRSRVKELEEELKDARSKIIPTPVSKWLSCHLCLYECATPDEMRNHLTNEHGLELHK